MTALVASRNDPAAWGALIDPADGSFGVRAEELRRTLAQLELSAEPTGRTHPVTDQRRGVLGPTAAAQAVRVRWRPGIAPGVPFAEHTLWFTITTTARGEPRLAGIDEGPGEPEPVPVWWTGPSQVVGDSTLVVLVGEGIDPAPWLDGLRTAHTDLARRGLDGRPLIAQLPANARDFERLLGVRPGTHQRVAAASWPFGAAAHLVVNPAAGGATVGEARQVLLTHEAVHLATGSLRGQRPLWLTEGYADLVALEGRPVAVAAHEAHLAADQRAHGIATALVTDDELAPTDLRVHAHYQRAWVTVRVLDAGPGRPGIADRVHAAVLTGTPLAEALAAEGWSEPQLAQAVAAELRRLVG